MRLRLNIQHPTDGERDYSTEESTVEIGRDPKATLSLADGRGTVSWRHARIELKGGSVRIEDLGSTNGTYVNGQRLATGQPAPLRVKDVIQFGLKGPRLQVCEIDLSDQTVGATMLMPASPAGQPAPATVYRARNGTPPPAPVQPTPVKPVPTTSQSGPTTRLMLAQTQQRFRLFTIVAVLCGVAGAGVVLVAVVIAVIALLNTGGPKTTPENPVANKDVEASKDKDKDTDISNPVFDRTVKSTAYIRIRSAPFKKDGKTMVRTTTGTGVLVDRDRRLVATAYHVIHGNKEIPLTFPKYSPSGELLKNEEDYANDFIVGTVWGSDPGLDLAIIQLQTVPAGVPEVKLAKGSPATGTLVHAVGGIPHGNATLWDYSNGPVRNVEERTENLGNGQVLHAWMVVTQNPINKGNSGGPLVNDRCELVGICSNMDPSANNVTLFTDIRHVKEMLREDRPHKVLSGGN
jgi:S1-C subfamily serine protease